MSSIAYLDAWMPEDGQSGNDFAAEKLIPESSGGPVSRPSPSAEFFRVNEKARRAFCASPLEGTPFAARAWRGRQISPRSLVDVFR